MRVSHLMAAAFCVLASAVNAKPPGTPLPIDNSHIPVEDPTNPAEAKADALAVAQLERPAYPFRCENAALDEIVAFFGDVSHLNVELDTAALNNAAIDPTSPVTVPLLQNVTNEGVLKAIFAASGYAANLDYQIRDGTIVISTPEALNRITICRVFDVRDLLPAPSTQPTDGADRLIHSIEAGVLPKSWLPEGGQYSLNIVKGRLVVVQTPAGQRQVANFLHHLRHLAVSQ
ncbi:MAG TPA: hypothetical protein VMD30_08300 [Tepidisphaeraceae bacterium]|nr:hypothetical protein [Tepidisphaeraceae bacterium]